MQQNTMQYTDDKPQMTAIIGPTASGKTRLAVALAQRTGGEVISADSRQVYRNMDIGTGKDLEDYVVNGVHVPYHLIDIAPAGRKYNVFCYQQDFLNAYHDIQSRGKKAILCGGTGLYVEAVLKGYRLLEVPEDKALRESLQTKSLDDLTEQLARLKQENGSMMHNTTDVDSKKRAIRAIEIERYYLSRPKEEREFPKIPSLVFGVSISRDERRRRITERLDERLNSGMVDEVKALIQSGIKPEDLIYYGLEYKYVTEYIIGKRSFDDMRRALEIAIHQFAKRQMTWFRGMERRGIKIHWLAFEDGVEANVSKIIDLAQQNGE